jgi:hypothetical protein
MLELPSLPAGIIYLKHNVVRITGITITVITNAFLSLPHHALHEVGSIVFTVRVRLWWLLMLLAFAFTFVLGHSLLRLQQEGHLVLGEAEVL